MYFFRLRKYFLSTLLLELFCHILQPIQADILSTQRKNRNAYTFRFPAERETGFEPATPTLARLYSTPEPLAHFLIFILLSARYTLQMIIYTNAPYLSTVFLNFFKKLKNIHDLHISHLFQSATTTSHRSATGRYRPHLPSSIPFPHTPQPPHADLPPADTDLPPVPNLRPWESSGGQTLRCEGHRKRGQKL